MVLLVITWLGKTVTSQTKVRVIFRNIGKGHDLQSGQHTPYKFQFSKHERISQYQTDFSVNMNQSHALVHATTIFAHQQDPLMWCS